LPRRRRPQRIEVDRDGKTISQDCGLCHSVLAQEEKDPEILKSLD
jgi:hypothetical protein